MKKTLCILGALLSTAALSQAEDTWPTLTLEQQVHTSNQIVALTTTEDFTRSSLANFSITFTLDDLDANGANRTFYTTWSGSSGLNITYTTDGKITLTHGSNSFTQSGAEVPSLDATVGTTYTMTVLNGKAYLWEGTSIPTTAPLEYADLTTLPNAGEYTLTKNGNNPSRLWSNAGSQAKTYVTLHTVTDLTNVTEAQYFVAPSPSVPVPEPATATLSLLALAGLAARRRRK